MPNSNIGLEIKSNMFEYYFKQCSASTKNILKLTRNLSSNHKKMVNIIMALVRELWKLLMLATISHCISVLQWATAVIYGHFGLKSVHNWVNVYRIVASRSTSRLVTCLGLFRLLMKGIFGPYVCTVTFWQKVEFLISNVH